MNRTVAARRSRKSPASSLQPLTGPDDAALGVDKRIAPAVNRLDDEVEAHLELAHAVHGEGAFDVRHVRRGRAVLDAMAIAGERIRAGAVDAAAVVFLQPREVRVGNRNHLLPRQALFRRNRPVPEVFGLGLHVDGGDVVGAAAARLEEDGFRFRDSSELDT